MQKILLFFLLFYYFTITGCQQNIEKNRVITGAEQTELYKKLLTGKSIAIVCNQSSIVDSTHLVDTLMSSGYKIIKIFSPEHGFRGIEDAGKTVDDTIDIRTGIEVRSLYGEKKKPSSDDLKGVDLVIFDIQDVGVRYYTYISTLHYIMEACAENSISVIIFDRPNPNGFYIDGPILEDKYKSFVGLHPVPIVHGMTIGEYAQMINGEGWLRKGISCNLSVIRCSGYSHTDKYKLKINPSPNLRNMRSIYLYPSLGLFEGTVMSVGRGTNKSFEVIGHPEFPEKDFYFIPKPVIGAENPKYLNKKCYGFNISNISEEELSTNTELDLSWLIKCFIKMNKGEKFFNSYFNYLSGNYLLKQQIIQGKTVDEIRSSWQEDIVEFKKIRKKYLLYPDFE